MKNLYKRDNRFSLTIKLILYSIDLSQSKNNSTFIVGQKVHQIIMDKIKYKIPY